MKVFNVSFQVETTLNAEEVKTAILEVIARGDLELESGPHEFALCKASTVTVRDEDHQLPEMIFDPTRPIGPVGAGFVVCQNTGIARDLDAEGGE